jgi:hypothetical protein
MTIRGNRSVELETQVITMLLGGLKEMLGNKDYCYVSANPKFSEIKEPGEEYVLTLVRSLLPRLVEAQQEAVQDAAEKRMLEQLQK